MLVAITALSTALIRIPTPATSGYIHPGDAAIIAAALLLGGARGALIGGIGSALADLIGGYGHYIPATFIIKGVEGYVCGLVGKDMNGRGHLWLRILGAIAGAAVMAGGYFCYQQLILGKAALVTLPGNIAQGLFGVVIGVALHRSLRAIARARTRR